MSEEFGEDPDMIKSQIMIKVKILPGLLRQCLLL